MPCTISSSRVDTTSNVDEVFERAILMAMSKRSYLSKNFTFASCQKVCFMSDWVVREEAHILNVFEICSGLTNSQSHQNCTIVLKKDRSRRNLLNLLYVRLEKSIFLVARNLWACGRVEHEYKVYVSLELMAYDRQFRTTWVHSQGSDCIKAFGWQIGHDFGPCPDFRVIFNAANMRHDFDFLGIMRDLPANK